MIYIVKTGDFEQFRMRKSIKSMTKQTDNQNRKYLGPLTVIKEGTNGQNSSTE